MEIMRAVLDVDKDCDFSVIRRLNEQRWDSLAHVSLVVAIENEFAVKLEIAEMERMTSFVAIRVLLKGKIDELQGV